MSSLALRIMWPVKANPCTHCFCALLCTMHMNVQLLKWKQVWENGRNGVQGEDVTDFFSLLLFLIHFWPYFIYFSSIFSSFISSLFCYLFSLSLHFALLLLSTRMDKNNMLIRHSLWEGRGRNHLDYPLFCNFFSSKLRTISSIREQKTLKDFHCGTFSFYQGIRGIAWTFSVVF